MTDLEDDVLVGQMLEWTKNCKRCPVHLFFQAFIRKHLREIALEEEIKRIREYSDER